MLWVSSAEPARVKSAFGSAEGRGLDLSFSPLPETLGADFAWLDRDGEWCGVQRKTVADLLASLNDGRFAKELGQLQQCRHRGLVVEGRARFTTDGKYVGRARMDLKQWHGMMFSLADMGVTRLESASVNATVALVLDFHRWTLSGPHTSLLRRPPVRAEWGKPDSREYGVHVLQGIPGIGVELAGRIFDLKGRVPLAWTVTEAELRKVRGIGREKAASIITALAG